MIYKTLRRGGSLWYLVDKANTQAHIDFLTWSMNQAGVFVNVAIKPYKGRKFNPAKMQYIVVG